MSEPALPIAPLQVEPPFARAVGQGTAPVFLVGALRSGTTLLRLMLNSHADLAIPFEFDFAVDSIADGGDFPDVDDYLEYLSSHRIFLATGLKSNRNLPYPELVQSYLAQAQKRANTALVGATIHRHFEHLPSIWPNARFIHLIRDGRDVSRSVVRMGWAGNSYIAADVWLDAERSWDRLRAKLPENQYHEVRFEDLVQTPEPILEGVCDFLGLEYDPEMLTYSRRSSYPPPDAREAAGWRRSDSARREAKLSEVKLAAMLRARGYGSAEEPLPELSRYEQTWLKFDSRARSFAFRARRMGPKLMAMDIATRRLPVPRDLRKKVQHQINAVELRYLR